MAVSKLLKQSAESLKTLGKENAIFLLCAAVFKSKNNLSSTKTKVRDKST
jgi:hypothetical protein